MSDTPESNKAERMAFAQEYMVPTDFARKLERERDEARAVIRMLWEKAEVGINDLSDEELDRVDRSWGESK